MGAEIGELVGVGIVESGVGWGEGETALIKNEVSALMRKRRQECIYAS